MARIRVAVILDVPPTVVWDDLRHIDRHVEWMADAESIVFTTATREGVGTAFDCVTRVGPFRTVDHMEVTAWKPERQMGIVHRGLITGSGSFKLHRQRGGRTRFVWVERLTFPWWLGGPITAFAAKPVLRWVWRRNLRRLAARFA